MSELTLKFDKFKMVVIHLGNDPGRPMVGEFYQFFLKVDGIIVHNIVLNFLT